jgi:hypothetical protein
MPVTPEAVVLFGWKFDFEFCEPCLEIIEWLGSRDPHRRGMKFQGGTQITCQFCDEVLQKPKQAMWGGKTSEPDTAYRAEVLIANSELSGEKDLYSRIHVYWFSVESGELSTWVVLALWTEKCKPNTSAYMSTLD